MRRSEREGTAAIPRPSVPQADEAAYHRARAIEEREAAARSSCMVRDVHLELADLYAEQAEAAGL